MRTLILLIFMLISLIAAVVRAQVSDLVDEPSVGLYTTVALTSSRLPNIPFPPLIASYLRRQALGVSNPSHQFDFQNIVIRFQLPEPVFGGYVIEHNPGGAQVAWDRCRTRADGAEECGNSTSADPALTGIYQLKIDRLPPGEQVRIGFLTSLGPEAEPYIRRTEEERGDSTIHFFATGTYEYLFGNVVERSSLFMRIAHVGHPPPILYTISAPLRPAGSDRFRARIFTPD